MGNEPGADGEVPFGALVVAADVVPLRHGFAAVIPAPSHEIPAAGGMMGGQHSAVELVKAFVALVQPGGIELRGLFQKPHVLVGDVDDVQHAVQCLPRRSPGTEERPAM